MLGLVQVQRLGSHPAMTRVAQPVLTAVAVAATLVKLLLMHAAQQREVAHAAAADGASAAQVPALPSDTDLPYFSGEAGRWHPQEGAALRTPRSHWLR